MSLFGERVRGVFFVYGILSRWLPSIVEQHTGPQLRLRSASGFSSGKTDSGHRASGFSSWKTDSGHRASDMVSVKETFRDCRGTQLCPSSAMLPWLDQTFIMYSTLSLPSPCILFGLGGGTVIARHVSNVVRAGFFQGVIAFTRRGLRSRATLLDGTSPRF